MTDPTADAAKLLPCPSCKSEKPEWRRAYVTDGKVQTCRDPYHDSSPRASIAAPCRQNGCYYGVQMAAARNTALDDAAELAADFDVDGDERYPHGLAAAIRALKVKET